MSFATFSEYLSSGNFTLSTPKDEYERRKKECGVRAVFEYACPAGHVSSSAISSFKNKKAKHKNNFDGFCAKCSSVPTDTTSSATGEAAKPRDLVLTETETHSGGGEEAPVSVQAETHTEGAEEEAPALEEAEAETEGSEEEHIKHADPAPESLLSFVHNTETRMRMLSDPFFENYTKRRLHLWQQFQATGDAMINSSCPYIATAIRWLTSTKNIVSKRYVAEKDIRTANRVPLFNTLCIPVLHFVVAIVPTFVYNLSPGYFFSRCKAIAPDSVLAVLLVNGGDIVDVWYIIPSKKLFSLVHRHSVDPQTPICVDQCVDETEYFCFEQTMFGIEAENA